MRIAQVVGAVVSTVKDPALTGAKFLVVETLGNQPERFIAVDAIGAGRGERVLVATGSAARLVRDLDGLPIDAAVVGIVDEVEGDLEAES